MTRYTPEAVQLATEILKASGSDFRYFEMQQTRDAIVSAAQRGIDGVQQELLAALTVARPWVVEALHAKNVDISKDAELDLAAIDAAIAKADGR